MAELVKREPQHLETPSAEPPLPQWGRNAHAKGSAPTELLSR
jgi:hypothetical protein